MHPKEKAAEGHDLIRFLTEARSIAVVGASTDPTSYASRPLAFLQRYGFGGDLWVVNPKHDVVCGIPSVASVADLPQGGVDVALVAVPTAAVGKALCGLSEAGVGAAVVIASGFGATERQHLAEVLRNEPLRVIGPNCLGVVAPRSNTYLTFSNVIGRGQPRPGSIALVTQSGAIGNAILISILRRGAGISHWFSTGDEADTGALELTAGLLLDDQVRGVGLFLEGVVDVHWLGRVRESIESTRKPVYLLKGARTAGGRSAAAGHTGRIVGSAEISLAVLRDAGIRSVPTLSALIDSLVALDVLKRRRGPRTGIVSVSGGTGVLAADAVQLSGELELASVDTDLALLPLLGGRISVLSNPLDVGGVSTERFGAWVNGFRASPSTDAVIAIDAGMIVDERELAERLTGRDAPEVLDAAMVIVPFSEGEPPPDDVVLRLAAGGIAVMPTLDRAVTALANLPAEQPTSMPAPVEDDFSGAAVGIEDLVVGPLARLPWARFKVAGDEQAALEFAGSIGYPVVLKAAGRTIEHRADIDAVQTGVEKDELVQRFRSVQRIAQRLGDAVIVQEQAPPGLELLVSFRRDPEVGLVAIIVPGGTLVELMSEQVVVWSGADPPARSNAVSRSRCGALLRGYRGRPPLDQGALLDLVEQVFAALEHSDLEFVEFNPVIVHAQGLSLVDGLARRRRPDLDV